MPDCIGDNGYDGFTRSLVWGPADMDSRMISRYRGWRLTGNILACEAPHFYPAFPAEWLAAAETPNQVHCKARSPIAKAPRRPTTLAGGAKWQRWVARTKLVSLVPSAQP